MLLFHGTDKKDLESILSNDFSLTSHVRHGSVYGKGIYFTNDINLALRYSEKYSNIKYIILVYIYVGDTVEGKKYPNILPKMPGSDNYYDTAVDCLSNPTQFIKKKNHEYNILGYFKLKFPDLNRRIHNTVTNNYINKNIKVIKPVINNNIFQKKDIIFLNKTNQEIFIYQDIKNLIEILNYNDNYFYKVKTNDISKLKFLQEISSKSLFQYNELVNTMFVCGYHDKEGMFNILNYFYVNNIDKKNTFIIDLLE